MGREVKRVPLDFEWPLNEVWQGYLMPDSLRARQCPDCRNGSTDAHEWLQAVAYIIAGLADDAKDEARGCGMHPYLLPLREISYNHAKGRPGPQFAEFADGIAPEAKGGFLGRDVHRVLAALTKAAGLPEKWGWCQTCDGTAGVEARPGQAAEAEAWTATEPPGGPGYQLWETVSEGSPITPVFEKPEDLARYMTTHGWGASDPMASSFDVAMRFIDAGWAPSMIATPEHGLESGVEGVGRGIEWTTR